MLLSSKYAAVSVLTEAAGAWLGIVKVSLKLPELNDTRSTWVPCPLGYSYQILTSPFDGNPVPDIATTSPALPHTGLMLTDAGGGGVGVGAVGAALSFSICLDS